VPRGGAPPDVTEKASAVPSSLFPIVGIGASAGGLAAVTELLKELPRGIGAAVVIIQHLDPEHGSLSGEILSRISPLPVSEVTDGMGVERGHVYVIPPNRDLRLERGLLKLSPRVKGRRHLPIDFFFESLARERKNKAIGVVLSGIASDGTNGVLAIKAAGGFTFAQDPSTAQYDGMPRSAIASGAVDTVDGPTEIAKDISEMVQWSDLHPGISEKTRPLSPPLKPDGALRRIFAFVRRATGVDFTHYKHSTIRRRIGRRLSLHKIENLQAYADYLEAHPEEVKALFDDILIHVTGFFRDPEAYEVLKTRILPKYLETFDPGGSFRVWVPGCSSGEEAYSIAIVLFELVDKAKVRPTLQIFASDISETSLQKARTAIYPDSIAKDVSKERLRRFFEKVENGYRVAKWIREACLFSRHDLTADPPFAKIDLISCRNVLIYLGSELQKRIVPILHYSLKPGGIFWLGRSESIAEFSNLFALQDRANKFYLKKNVTAALKLRFSIRGQVPDFSSVPGKTINSSTTLQELLRESDRAAVREYAPPAVVIDDSLEILNVHGRLSPYLELAPGRATLNVLKLAHPEVAPRLRDIVEAARRQNAPMTATGLTLQTNGEKKAFGIRVVPLHLGTQVKERYFSIFFEEPVGAIASRTSRSKAERRGPKPRHEIREPNYDEALIEEYQATQEELTSSNEELQSTNEELQSTNEELETAKEELQSANEELTTINDELQARNAEMAQLTNDLTNLLASLDTAIVMVGADGKIRRFTPKAGQILTLIPTDVGRPIGDIKPGFQAPDLDEMAADVMANLTIKELETRDKKGTWYRLQVRPYRTADSRIDGAVFVLTDIMALKQAADVLTTARDDARNIIETMPNAIVVVGSDLRVQGVNDSYCRMFQVDPVEAEGKLLSELCDGSWDIASLREKLEAVLRTGTAFTDVEVEGNFPRVGFKSMALHATATRLTGAGTNTALLAIEDLTARKRAADQLRHAEENYRHLLERAHDGVLIVDQQGTIEFANQRLEDMFGYASGELKGKSYELLIPAQYLETHRQQHQSFMRNPESRDMGRGIDLLGTRKDGTIIPLEISLSPLQVDSNILVTAIVRDISTRKKIEEERRALLARETEARHDAERANQVKDEFLATLSHELRTPLTTILSWAQILRLKRADEELANKAIAQIEKGAKDQSQLIEDLLDISRIQAGKVRLELADIEPIECVAAALDSVRGLAEDKSITLRTEFDPSPCRIEADSARLQQIFRNLLTNAVKFTRPGGTVTVRSRLKVDPAELEIQVQDTGKGIRRDFLPYLFQRFSQEDSSAKRAFGGLGLGLSIARNLVDMHGGTVTADSAGEGKGAVFTVTLPCEPAGRSRSVGAVSGSDKDVALRAEEPAGLNGLRVLIIDDQEDARDALTVLLESLGAQVHSAENAQQGLAALVSYLPDVVLCDIAMPDEDGFSLIRKVRALEPRQGGRVPMVAVTAYAERENIQRCLDAGFDAHLAKPMDVVDLAHLIGELAGRPKPAR
jgi:two-component system CheB/CheR fusion protein